MSKTLLLRNTLSSVFMPTLMTILGTVLFLRYSWIVETAGILTTLTIVSITALIALITTLSLSTTASNMKIGSGGVYYILSRTFGVRAGCAISIPLFLAQAVGITFYLTAFTESVRALWPELSPLMIASAALAFLTGAALISSRTIMRLQLAIFFLVASAIGIVYFTGVETAATVATPLPFWATFALFFPAFTGFEVGVAMADELEKPHLSLLFGSSAAILIAFVLYLAAGNFLSAHPFHVNDLGSYHPLVTAGLWGATLSGAVTNLLGAPRLIGALAEEKIIPHIFTGKRAILLTAVAAFAGFFVGDLNQIALLLTLFFLIAYGMINFATGIEAVIHNPSWRPLINTPWPISIGGGALCTLILLLIDPAWALSSLALVILLFLLMKKKTAPLEDMRHSILLFLSRYAVTHLSTATLSPRNWRPNLLVFVGDPKERPHLTHLTTALTHKKGFLTFASIVTENVEKMRETLAELSPTSLATVKKSPHIHTEIEHLIENYGLGPIVPNTVVLGATKDEGKFGHFASVVNTCANAGKNIVIVRENGFEKRIRTKEKMKRQKIIDVWWGGLSKQNSELMLLLAHMLSTSDEWRGARLNLKTATTADTDLESLKKELNTFATSGRFNIHTKIVPHDPDKDLFTDTIGNASRDADLVFLGLRAPDDTFPDYYRTLLQKTKSFPPLAFVLAGEPLPFSQILDN